MLSADSKQKIEAHIQSLPKSLCRPLATEQQLQEFEVSYGPIPEDYRWFLLACGGGYFGSERVDDIEALAQGHKKFQRESGVPRGWKMQNVFIIGWDGSGNPFGIDRATGRIVVEDHTFGGIHELATSLELFMLKAI